MKPIPENRIYAETESFFGVDMALNLEQLYKQDQQINMFI